MLLEIVMYLSTDFLRIGLHLEKEVPKPKIMEVCQIYTDCNIIFVRDFKFLITKNKFSSSKLQIIEFIITILE